MEWGQPRPAAGRARKQLTASLPWRVAARSRSLQTRFAQEIVAVARGHPDANGCAAARKRQRNSGARKGQPFQSREPVCGGVAGAGQSLILGGNGLLGTRVVALPDGRRRKGGRARAGGRPPARARPASRTAGASGMKAMDTHLGAASPPMTATASEPAARKHRLAPPSIPALGRLLPHDGVSPPLTLSCRRQLPKLSDAAVVARRVRVRSTGFLRGRRARIVPQRESNSSLNLWFFDTAARVEGG